MILSYSVPSFKQDILDGIKVHTFRTDVRWKAGRSIQHWMHNPRNVKKNPHHFGDDTCKSTQQVVIRRDSDAWGGFDIWIDDKKMSDIQKTTIFKNDGFKNIDDFRNWFVPPERTYWKGVCIHWTDLKY